MSCTEDIARILRRDCPAERLAISKSSVVTSAEDDQWPLDGTENSEKAEGRWNKSFALNDDWDQQLPSKRRRVLSPIDSRSNPFVWTMSATLESPIISTDTTTMQSSSSFSYVAHGGFTTAASQLQAIEAEATRSTIAANANLKATKSSKNSSSTRRSVGQSSLATYFGKPSLPDIRTAATVQIPTTIVRVSNPIAKASAQIFMPVESNEDSTTNEIALPPPRRPLHKIPQNLSTHRLTNIPTARPGTRPLDHDDDSYSFSRKNYPFLSSSPQKPPSPIPRAKDPLEDNTTTCASVLENATRPASTFHTTTVQQVGTRRTLGVKRSMNGWAARGGFEVPRRVG